MKNNYWDYLCGSSDWKRLGLQYITPKSLETFDNWYLEDFYPYLKKYLPVSLDGNVLEIGLGFGTVSQFLFNSCKSYVGLDFAYAPVETIKKRAKYQQKNNVSVIQGDAKNLPFRNEVFDSVTAIGCLHHTGNLHQSVLEIYRVLKKNCSATVMIYNRYSFRRIVLTPLIYFLHNILKVRNSDYSEFEKSLYDSNLEGEPPPFTEFFSKKDVINIFSPFSNIQVKLENFDEIRIPKTEFVFPRKLFLNNLARLLGLDIYIIAAK